MRAHTAAVLAALDAADVHAGLGSRPEAAAGKWAVVYPMGRAEAHSLSQPYDGFTYTVQVVSVGQGPEQAEWLADKVRATLLAPLSISGRTWLAVEHAAGTLQRDDAVNPPLYHVSETFRIRSGTA
jgi:hypothetical protein